MSFKRTSKCQKIIRRLNRYNIGNKWSGRKQRSYTAGRFCSAVRRCPVEKFRSVRGSTAPIRSRRVKFPNFRQLQDIRWRSAPAQKREGNGESRSKGASFCLTPGLPVLSHFSVPLPRNSVALLFAPVRQDIPPSSSQEHSSRALPHRFRLSCSPNLHSLGCCARPAFPAGC